MTKLEAHLDRLEIETVLRIYAVGLDERRFELWSDVFTTDAVIDFTPMGGKRETPDEMRDRLSNGDPDWLFAQHPVFNTVIELSADSAVAHSDYLLKAGKRTGERLENRMQLTSGGGTYRDTLQRTDDGWRITERAVSMKWKRVEVVQDDMAGQRQRDAIAGS